MEPFPIVNMKQTADVSLLQFAWPDLIEVNLEKNTQYVVSLTNELSVSFSITVCTLWLLVRLSLVETNSARSWGS